MKVIALVVHLIFIYLPWTNGRQLQLTLNPNCTGDCVPVINGEPVNLVYVRADGENDTIHYLWSSIGTFASVILKSTVSASVRVNWTSLMSGKPDNAIQLTEEPFYKRAILITKVWEFDDENDTVSMESIRSNEKMIAHQFYNFSWSKLESVNGASNDASVQFKLRENNNTLYKTDSLKIKASAFGTEGHAKTMPQLHYDDDTMHLDIIMDKFSTIFNHTRFGLEFAIVKNKQGFQLETSVKKSLDDEYTPGVFQVVQVYSTGNESDYLQWKPIAYVSDERSTEKSTACLLYGIKDRNITKEILSSIVPAVFDLDKMAVKKMNISFGINGDGFYQAYNYLTWSVAIGIGDPPKEKFSFLVIMVIIVGFGLPAVLILGGSIFIMWKRCSSRRVRDELNTRLIN